MRTRRASCSCGQLTVEVEGDPVRVSICHCLACQRRTGSVFGVQARWPREQARIEGLPLEYLCQDLNRIDLGDLRVDLVVCQTILHHVLEL